MAEQPRIPLSRERILEAALGLADRAGVEAVTMRRLGDELGFEAMSLYGHVANKNDLLDGMLDLVLAEWEPADERVDWTESIRASAESVHEALLRHPWSARLLMSHIRPARLRYMDRLLATLRVGGIDPDAAYHVYHLLDGFIFGYTLWEIAYTSAPMDDDVVTRLMQMIPWDEYPDLAAHRDQHMTEGPHREVSSFRVGLDLILDGLRAR
ncbi:MAG: TetR/AcrR family transcriptional regulator C-terminal domain-containing protein [Gaiellaceae bacterium]